MSSEINRQLRENDRRRRSVVADAVESWRRMITAIHFDNKFERLCDLDLAEVRGVVDELAKCKQAACELRAEYERLKAEV